MMRKLLLLWACCAGVSNLLAQDKSAIEFVEYDLDNGLHVILQSNHSSPVVAIGVLYGVGSKYEKPQHTGFAHLFEHLLFEGSEHIGRGEFDLYIQRAGGEDTAGTGEDDTYYHEVFPSHQLEMGLWLESERMLHARVDSVGLATQLLVVKEEKRESENNDPYTGVMEALWRAAFPGTPYEWPIIGYIEDLDRATLDEVAAFYRQFYVPENAVLCIVGDIELNRARELVDRYFADINRKPPRPIQRPAWKDTWPEREIRDTVYSANIAVPMTIQAYRIPGLGHPDEAALQALAAVLGGGSGSRLKKALYSGKGKALDIGTDLSGLQDAGLFITYAIPNEGVILEDLDKAIDKEVEKLRRQAPSEKELQAIQNQAESALIDERLSVEEMAESLARAYFFYGSTEHINKRIDRLRAVTPKDLQRVAVKYLVERNKVTVWGLPKPHPSTAATPGLRR